jgi:hypothetical protein
MMPCLSEGGAHRCQGNKLQEPTPLSKGRGSEGWGWDRQGTERGHPGWVAAYRQDPRWSATSIKQDTPTQCRGRRRTNGGVSWVQALQNGLSQVWRRKSSVLGLLEVQEGRPREAPNRQTSRGTKVCLWRTEL